MKPENQDQSKFERIQGDLIQQKLLLDNLLRTIPDNVYFKDLESRFIRVSDAMIRYFNLNSPEEIIGKTDFDFFTEVHASEAYHCEQEIIKTGIGVSNVEERETWPDGHITWTSTSKVPLTDANGRLMGTLGISHDITVRKTMELALEESLRNKDKLLSIIGHDLRNPMASISLVSDIALDELRDLDMEQLKKDLEMIRSASRQAQNLLENLLQWARSQQGRMKFNPEDTDFSLIVTREIDLLHDLTEQKQIRVAVKIPAPCYVFADSNMIATILRNLIHNALKFTRIGGQVTVGSERTPTEIVVSVSDNGMGMPSEMADKVFEIDTIHSTSGTQGEKGSGLGLVICREFVAIHGGRIWVESAEGIGSTFYFTIPFKTT